MYIHIVVGVGRQLRQGERAGADRDQRARSLLEPLEAVLCLEMVGLTFVCPAQLGMGSVHAVDRKVENGAAGVFHGIHAGHPQLKAVEIEDGALLRFGSGRRDEHQHQGVGLRIFDSRVDLGERSVGHLEGGKVVNVC